MAPVPCEYDLLASTRLGRARGPRAHDGTFIPDMPDQICSTDATSSPTATSPTAESRRVGRDVISYRSIMIHETSSATVLINRMFDPTDHSIHQTPSRNFWPSVMRQRDSTNRRHAPVLLRLSISILLFFFVAQFDVYLYHLGIVPVSPYIQEVAATLIVAMCYVITSWGKPIQRPSKETIVLLLCLACYVLVQIAGVFSWVALPDETMLITVWIYTLLLLTLGLAAGAIVGSWVQHLLLVSMILFVIMLVVPVVTEGFDGAAGLKRTASTVRNSNVAASLIVLLMLGSIRWSRPGALAVVSIATAGFGVALTQSRAGLIMFGLAATCYLTWWALNSRHRASAVPRMLIVLAFMIVMSGASAALIYSRAHFSNAYVYEQQADGTWQQAAKLTADDGARYDNDTYSVSVNNLLHSAPARTRIMWETWELIKKRPIEGHGTSYVFTMQLGPHNMFLKGWVEIGILGVLSFTLLLAGILWMGLSRRDPCIVTLALVLFGISMTSHNLTESRSLVIVIGVLIASSALRKTYVPRVIPLREAPLSQMKMP